MKELSYVSTSGAAQSQPRGVPRKVARRGGQEQSPKDQKYYGKRVQTIEKC